MPIHNSFWGYNPEEGSDPFAGNVEQPNFPTPEPQGPPTDLPDPSEVLGRDRTGNGGGFNPYGDTGFPNPNDPTQGPQDPTSGFTGDFGSLPDWAKKLIPGLSDDPSSALMIPSWMAAYKQWQDGDKYYDQAKEASKYGDPFGADQRKYYQDRLQRSYEHPEEFLNDPGHQAKLKSGLDAVSRQDAAKGYMGSGNMLADLAAYTNNLDNQWLSDERKNMQSLTGAQFNPAAAGEMLMKGNDQKIQSQNAALQSMFMPFMMKSTNNYLNNNANGGPGSTNNNNTKPGSTNNNPSTDPGLVRAVTSGDKAAIDAAINAGTRFVKLPDGSTADLYAMARGGYRTGETDGMEYPTGVRGNAHPGAGSGAEGGGYGGGDPNDPPPVGGIPDPNFPEPELPDVNNPEDFDLHLEDIFDFGG